MDELLGVTMIHSVHSDDENFYLVANKKEHKMGFFLYKISQKNPKDCKELIGWYNKLAMGDCNV